MITRHTGGVSQRQWSKLAGGENLRKNLRSGTTFVFYSILKSQILDLWESMIPFYEIGGIVRGMGGGDR